MMEAGDELLARARDRVDVPDPIFRFQHGALADKG